MELIWRSIYHSVLTFLNCTTSWVNQDAYKYNIKRIRVILTNDYGRVTVSEEVQSESEGSCSVATEIISTCDIDAELREFECRNMKDVNPEKLLTDNPMGHKFQKKVAALEFPMIHMAISLKYSEAVLNGTAWIPPIS